MKKLKKKFKKNVTVTVLDSYGLVTTTAVDLTEFLWLKNAEK